MVGKARARPDQVRKVLDSVAQQGALSHLQEGDEPARLLHPARLLAVRRGRPRSAAAPRSSASGQLVAAAGNEYALHAEYNWVPVNLCVPVPDGVAPEHAAFATVGAIAMQGVRQAEVPAGRHRVRDRPRPGRPAGGPAAGRGRGQGRRPRRARRTAAGWPRRRARCWPPRPPRRAWPPPRRRWPQVTDGLGADHVLLAAGGSSNGPVEAAARLARDRARVVDIGKTRLDLPWNAYYDKELDVRFSRSYGPGPLRRPVRARGHRLPGRLRALDRAAQPGLLPRPDRPRAARSGARWSPASSRSTDADRGLRRPGVRRAGRGGRRAARVPGTGRGQRAARGQPAGARRPPGRPPGRPKRPAGRRVHRRGQLRDRPCCCRTWPSWTTVAAGARGHQQVAVGGQRPAAVRLRAPPRPTADAVLERRVAGRDLHRDPAPHARRAGLPGAGDRQGGVRREAAGADPRRARADHGHGGRAPATTG